MTTEMILLGMMHEKSLSGYEMKKICHEQFTHYTDINLSSIYSTLNRLEKNALIKGKIVQGARMEKKVFTITEEGKKQFKKLLDEHIKDHTLPGFRFNSALTFAHHINKKLLKEILEERRKMFKEYLIKFEKAKEGMGKEKLEKSEILLNRGMSHMKAELEWIKQAIEELK